MKNSRIVKLIGIGLLALGMFGSVFGQDRRPDTGFKAGNSYAIGDIENVNLTNGNLGVNLPLAALPAGRGGNKGFGIGLNYNSKMWGSEQERRTDGVPNESGDSTYMRELVTPNEDPWVIQGNYQLIQTDRRSLEERAECKPFNEVEYSKNPYRYKVEVATPDGSKISFRPYGTGSFFYDDDGFFAIDINGSFVAETLTTITSQVQVPVAQCSAATSGVISGMNYYSTDGSRVRLFIPYRANLSDALRFTMYFPDGRIVETNPQDAPNTQRITDPNGNKVVIKSATYNGISGTKIEDELGRFIFYGQELLTGDTKVYQSGANNEILLTTVKWKNYWVYRKYIAYLGLGGNPNTRNEEFRNQFRFVDKIILPTQANSLEYSFTYNANPSPTQPSQGEYTTGWGELKSIVLPTGVKSEYTYQLEGNSITLGSFDVTSNAVIKKDLKYTTEYDGISTQKTETWDYSSSPLGGSVFGPNGSGSLQRSSGGSTWDASLVYREQMSDGTRVEKIWLENAAPTITGNPGQALNPYVKTEFTTIPNANGQPSLTAIKDFTYDKNGNVLEVKEYDWVDYASIPHQTYGNDPIIGKVTGIPSNATLKRITSNQYYNQTPVATDSTSSSPNMYANPSSPKLKNVLKATEIKDANGVVVSRSEFYYDDPNNKGNLTETKVWDSYKNGTYQAYSNPLTAANSISSTVQYDQYGNPTLSTDAKGTQTQITYGAINGYTGLYPTQVKSAYGTAIEQTSQTEYDFSTGLPKKVTALGNTAAENVVSETEYDAIGRSIKTKTAVGTPSEIWSTMEYDDIARRMISRSDIAVKGDGKKISVQHFDQLGRVRLTRSIENSATEDPYNEAHGIKVQTRYETGNPYSYQLSSNPYRAATAAQATNEESMGWTRSKSINTGKHSETETFSGAGLPAPWGTNTSSTGKVQTDIDGERTLVTDQSGKQRISKTNALGQLLNVWEVKESDADTEAIAFGNLSLNGLKTSYQYDTLNNLKQVNQGVQTRTFAYSSLSRLVSANNPESGLISYKYDVNGNLSTKTDARSITTTYNYDVLNRVTLRDYSDTTPDVSYTYDNGTNAKGKLTKVYSSVSTTEYTSFDILGRVLNHKQTTDGNIYNSSYVYNLSGALIEETYPSGRVVKNTIDQDGDLQQVQSRKSGDTFRNYANAFTYTSAGAVSSMRLGNGKFENTTFNSRLQPIQIGLGSSATSQNLLKLNFDYGGNDNNGNVKSQTITTPTIGTNQGFVATQIYAYDSLNRLKSAVETIPNQTGWKQTFIFDRYGNRTFDTANNNTTTLANGCPVAICNPSANPQDNKLAGTNYDVVGNTKIDANGQTFTYDAENKQTKVVNGQGVTLGEYFYDGDGKRIKKIVPSTQETTIFVYDASNKLVAEYSTIKANQAEAEIRYLTNDHLGSPRITTDSLGKVVSRRDFMPFGEEIARASYGNDSVRQKFTGYERDNETNLDYAKARMFGSGLGRFTSPDPMLSSGRTESPQTWNRYAYVDNNPLNFTDPLGLYKYGASLEDSDKLSDKERARRKELREKFEAGLQKANENLKVIEERYGKDSMEYKEAKRGVSAYGTLNDNTKVIVELGGKQGAKVDGKLDKAGNAIVKFSADQLNQDNRTVASVTGHEGIHIDNVFAGKTLGNYEDEYQGNWVQSVLAEANYMPPKGIGQPFQNYSETGKGGGTLYDTTWGTGKRTMYYGDGTSRTFSIPEMDRHAAVNHVLKTGYDLVPPPSR